MKDLTKGRPSVLILTFALPIFLANLLQLTYSLADTRIVGTFLGDSALAAVGATTTLSNLIVQFLMGMCNGFAIISAQCFGAKDMDRLRRSLGNSLVLGLLAAVVLTIGGLVFLQPILRFLNVPENLLNYEETPGASEAINKWVDQGHEVFIITGRPFNSYEPSRQWLDEHHLERVPLFCVDKYGRETAKQDYRYNMTLAELYNMTFDFAVEDSPAAFEHVMHFDNCRIAVFDRPWNSRAELPNDRFVRCKDWQEIDRLFENREITK